MYRFISLGGSSVIIHPDLIHGAEIQVNSIPVLLARSILARGNELQREKVFQWWLNKSIPQEEGIRNSGIKVWYFHEKQGIFCCRR